MSWYRGMNSLYRELWGECVRRYASSIFRTAAMTLASCQVAAVEAAVILGDEVELELAIEDAHAFGLAGLPQARARAPCHRPSHRHAEIDR